MEIIWKQLFKANIATSTLLIFEQLFWFGLDKCQVPTKTALSLPLLSWTGERKYDERLEGREKDRERSLTSYCQGQNRLNLGRKESLIYHQSNQNRIMRNKTKSLITFPPPLPSSPAQLQSQFLSLLPPMGAGGQGMGIMVSSSHAVSAAPSSSGGGLLTLCPCSRGRSLSQETVLHKRLQCESFPWAADLHELPQCGSLPWGAVLQEQAAPACIPPGVTSPASKPARRGLLSPWVRRSCQEPASAQAPHEVTASFRHPPAPAWGPFHGLQEGICSTEDLHGLQGDNLPHHGLQHELQGKALCSSVSSTSSPSFFTDLGVCRVVSFT